MEAKLIVRKGPRKGEVFKIPEGTRLVLGRSMHCDLQLLDEGLSRTHAMIENHGTSCDVCDLESSNGTFLNGKKIKVSQLRDGDVIKMGDAILEFSMSADQSKTASTIRIIDDTDTFNLKSKERVKKRMDDIVPVSLSKFSGGTSTAENINRSLGNLYKISDAIHKETHLPKLFEKILDSVLEVISADRAFVLKADKDGVVKPASSRVRGEEADVVISSSVLNEAVSKGLSVLVSDAQLDERFSSGASILANNIHSVMCVPMKTVAGKILGALYMDTVSNAVVFTESDLEFLTAVGHQAATSMERLSLFDCMEKLLFDTVHALVSSIEAKDEYTSGHSERVTTYALQIARELGYNGERLEYVKLAGLLHDVGKIGVPEDLLTKKGKLTQEEWIIMRSHPEISARILNTVDHPIMRYALEGAKYHHEKLDGSGYPEGLKGDQIPEIARIIAVADAYDAMTSNRRYRANFDDDAVIQEFKRCAGSHFDREVVRVFTALMERGEVQPLAAVDEALYRRSTESRFGYSQAAEAAQEENTKTPPPTVPLRPSQTATGSGKA